MLRRKDNATIQALLSGKDTSELGDKCSELLVDAYEFFRSALRAPGCDLEAVR